LFEVSQALPLCSSVKSGFEAVDGIENWWLDNSRESSD